MIKIDFHAIFHRQSLKYLTKNHGNKDVQYVHSITPENTKKPLVFWCFQGVQNGNVGQIWVNTRHKESSVHNF